MSRKISIIMPVYNNEKFVSKAIKSVLEQTYSNIELIIVNDGSSDASLAIVNGYTDIDKRVKIFNQKNKGVSAARNKGIIESTGDFMMFLDSDDYLEKHTISNLLKKYKNKKSLIVFNFNVIGSNQFNNASDYLEEKSTLVTMKELSGNFWYYQSFGITNSPCNKLYESSIIKEKKIFFPEDITMGEDIIFNLDYFEYINNLIIVNEKLYNYIIHSNQSTMKIKVDIADDMVVFLDKIESFIYNYNNDEIERNRINLLNDHYHQVLKHLIRAIEMSYRTDKLNNSEKKEQIKKNRLVFFEKFNDSNLVAKSFYEKFVLYLLINQRFHALDKLFKNKFRMRSLLKNISFIQETVF